MKKLRYRNYGKIYKTPRYRKWRKAVFERDRYCCRLCRRTKIYIEAHHINKKSTNVALTYNVANGITLCKRCHDMVTGDEDRWIYLFAHIIRDNICDLKVIKQKVLDGRLTGHTRNK